MNPDWYLYICLVLGWMSLTTAGVFGAFSTFIMKALGRTQTAGAIEAMQHINRVVLKTDFVFSLIALAPLSTAFAIYAALKIEGVPAALIILAATVYVGAVFAVTMRGNVPLNERLDQMVPADLPTAAFWQTYVRDWTRLNHIRTAGSLATAALYLSCIVIAL